ncbi:hypothetical protein DLM78_14000 [Leptospira stimsonii]|uniref:Uncharacterized protein n=1 Tax=Leptospira stimsonii TaxID=2202203 RepID=A0A8B3CPF5_9LEPT|nr:hypothetical protein DLM78_14000 [Leptospira stimsonii]
MLGLFLLDSPENEESGFPENVRFRREPVLDEIPTKKEGSEDPRTSTVFSQNSAQHRSSYVFLVKSSCSLKQKKFLYDKRNLRIL